MTYSAMNTCRVLLVASTLGFSWLGMMAVHELGHVLHAMLSGGVVARVVLGPLEMSRTDLWRNPHPAFVAAGGAVWGAVLPLVLSLAVPVRYAGTRQLVRFFAGFCLVANGIYLLIGGLHDAGDPGDLRHLGVPLIALLLAGVFETVFGLGLWHRLGPGVGFGPPTHERPCRTAALLVTLLCVVVALEWAMNPAQLDFPPTASAP
jgi:hypothetical protein